MQNNSRNKGILVALSAIALLFAAGFSVWYLGSQKEDKNPDEVYTGQVTNFEECVAAGNSVMESYPRQCRHNGTIYIEEIKQGYEFSDFGMTFSYPENYFVAFEKNLDGEREQHAVVLAEDTPANRALFSDSNSATEGPPTITITIFQNNLDNYTLQSFVEGTNFSNFKMSDGKKTEITVGGEPAWRYHATGLYENDNVVVVRPDYVYMFTAFFGAPTDRILDDFDALLETVMFSDAAPTGQNRTSTGGGIVFSLRYRHQIRRAGI